MEVIKRGITPSEKVYVCSCYTCNSVIRYKFSEVIKVSSDQRDGDSHFLGTCPVCKESLYNYSPKEEDKDVWYTCDRRDG